MKIYGNSLFPGGLGRSSILENLRGDKKVQQKIERLLKSIQATPYEGLGKPEPLKHNWAGYWARRITGEHRLVYQVVDGKIFVAQLRFHY